MFKQVVPYGQIYRQDNIGVYRSGGYVKTIGSTTDTLGKLVKKRGGKMKRGGRSKY